jgi:hypothetical protein
MTRVLLHIGTHKTGTTSIQHFLRDHLGEPAFPAGYEYEENHSLIAHSLARPGRLVGYARVKNADGPATLAGIPNRVRADLARADDLLVLSGESLSLLRFDDEVERVMQLFTGSEVEVVMYTRCPVDFLRAYRLTMQVLNYQPSDDPDSIHYVEPDSWLVRYHERVDLLKRHTHVHHFDYDALVAHDGSVIPSFAALVGIEPTEYRLNSSAALKAFFEDRWRHRGQ